MSCPQTEECFTLKLIKQIMRNIIKEGIEVATINFLNIFSCLKAISLSLTGMKVGMKSTFFIPPRPVRSLGARYLILGDP